MALGYRRLLPYLSFATIWRKRYETKSADVYFTHVVMKTMQVAILIDSS